MMTSSFNDIDLVLRCGVGSTPNVAARFQEQGMIDVF